ncbi:hypothetical protein GCM10017687_03060 [Streptomyces echinatus]
MPARGRADAALYARMGAWALRFAGARVRVRGRLARGTGSPCAGTDAGGRAYGCVVAARARREEPRAGRASHRFTGLAGTH